MPPSLPDHLLPVVQKFQTVEYATLPPSQAPLTYPVTPYIGQHTLDVSTGLAYPAKAERARRNPKVCLLYSYPKGSGLDRPLTIVVYGHAAVRDANLQANTDRYVSYVAPGLPFPPFILKSMTWYFARIWIEITPLRILWWEAGDLQRPPQAWCAAPDLPLPASDPAPPSAELGRWKSAPSDWRPGARYAAAHLGTPVLTVVDADGYPVPCRVHHAELVDIGFGITLPQGAPAPARGKACLTFHSHPEQFTGQENMVFIGTIDTSGELFVVQKRAGDWSLPPRGFAPIFSMFGNGLKLRPRLKAEAARRNQAVPKVNLPPKGA